MFHPAALRSPADLVPEPKPNAGKHLGIYCFKNRLLCCRQTQTKQLMQSVTSFANSQKLTVCTASDPDSTFHTATSANRFSLWQKVKWHIMQTSLFEAFWTVYASLPSKFGNNEAQFSNLHVRVAAHPKFLQDFLNWIDWVSPEGNVLHM